MDFFGYRDVQIWNVDANGHMNGNPGFDRKNPRCFCFDCRGAFDPKGEVDAEIVNAGHERAREVYISLLPAPTPLSVRTVTSFGGGGGGGSVAAALPTPPASPKHPHLPMRTMTEHPEAYARGVSRSLWFPSSPVEGPPRPPPIQIPTHNEGAVPMSLPAPRHRDVMNESRETRIKKDLLELLTRYRGQILDVMDSRRTACFYDDPKKRDELMAEVRKKEDDLWDLIHAVELIISSLDD
jgi:hypothetical protein